MDPDDVRRVLVTEQRKFTKGWTLERTKPLLGRGLLTSTGEFHLHQRRLMQPAFHRERLTGYGDVMVRYTERAITGSIDTATYAAVLAMDTVAARYAELIARYVLSGGGLVLWPPALAALAPAATSATVLPVTGDAPSDTVPRSVLALAPMTHLNPDALILE